MRHLYKPSAGCLDPKGSTDLIIFASHEGSLAIAENQYNERARAALNNSSKKPTRQDPSHKQESKQQTETTKEHGDLANRGGL